MKALVESFSIILLRALSLNGRLAGVTIFMEKNFRIIPVILFFLYFYDPVSASGVTKPNEPGPWPAFQVNTYTGNLFYQRNDLYIPARGQIPLAINFAYNSLRNQQDRGYGNGWSFSFGMWYSKTGNTVTIGRGDGQEDEFTWTGAVYVPPAGVYDALTEYATDKYLLTTKHGIKYYFEDSSHKRLTKIVDRNGNTISLTYTGGKPTVITDPSGRVLNLTWTNGHLSQIADPNTTPGRTITFQYDGTWNTIQVTRPLSNVYHYGYDSSGYMTSVTDPRSANVTISYNVDKAVESMNCSAVGYTKVFFYDICDNTTTVIQSVSLGNRSTFYIFDTLGRVSSTQHPDGNWVYYAWDTVNNLITFTNEKGYPTSCIYDTKGNLLSEMDCLGNTASSTYESMYNHVTSFTDKNGITTTYSYDTSGNRTGMVDCIAQTESYTYNSFGEMISATNKKGTTTTYSYNAYGDQTVITDALGNSEINTFDLVGNLLNKTDKRGYTTTYSYDLLNRHTGTVDALGYTSTYEYDANANLTGETKPNGYVTTWSYDSLNRQISKYSILEGTTSDTYDEADNRISETNALGCTTLYTFNSRDWLTGTLDPLGYTESFAYSPVGKILSSTDKGGNTTVYQYDCLDRLIKKTDPVGFFETYTYNVVSNMTSHTDKNGNIITFAHDWANRLTGTSFPLGYSETTVYDAVGNRINFTNKDGKTMLYSYDTLGRLIHVIDPLGFMESYTYDPGGNRTGSTDKFGYPTTYTYDNLGRLILKTDLVGNTETYGYDPDGNRTSLMDKNGHTTIYAYDGLDRLTGKTDPLGFSESYSYDELSNQTAYTDKNGNTSTMTYNCLNRQISKTDPYGFSDTFVYDSAGHVISRTDRNGHVTTYTYSCCKRTGTTDPLGFTESYAYDPNGNLTTFTDKNGHVTVSTFDSLNRLSAVTTPMGHQTHYTYNGAGSILTKTDANLSTITNVYDARNQLLSTSYPDATAVSYSYDNTGNIVQTTSTGGIGDITTYTYDILNNNSIYTKETNYGSFSKTTTFTHDNNGTRTSMTTEPGTITYLYDNDDRLTSITDQDSKVTTFEYDSAGNQVTLSYPNGVHTFTTYDHLDRVTRVVSTDGSDHSNLPIKNPEADIILPGSPLFTIDCGVMQIISPQTGPGLTNHELVTILLMNYGISPVSGAVASYSINGGTPVMETVPQPLIPGVPLAFTFSQTADLSIPGQSYQLTACVQVTGDENPANNCMTSTVINQSTGGGINQSFTYTYDHVGNKTSEMHEDSTTVSFQYDQRNQLVQEETLPSGNLNLYTYTPTGKRASKTENGVLSTYSYNNDDILIAAGGTTYVPDNNGNRISKTDSLGTTYYYYGYKNELTHVLLPDLSYVDYKYSPFGSHLATNENGVWTYIQSNGRELLSLVDASGQPVEFYNPGLTIHYADTTGYYHYNGYESSTLQVDSVPAVMATAGFDAFGNIVHSSGTWLDDRIIFANLSYQDTVDLYTDGYGLFYDETTGTVINEKTGEKTKDPAVTEPETKKPQETGGTNPAEETAKPKCCGVKTFVVTWSEPKEKKVNDIIVMVHIDVVIEFMKDNEHDPACCKYCQNVSKHWEITAGPQKGLHRKRGTHDDNYSRANDHDKNPELNDAGFTTDDNPGIEDFPEYFDEATRVDYTFTAEQFVIENCPEPCPYGKIVAKIGPQTIHVTGKNGDYKFDPKLPITLDK